MTEEELERLRRRVRESGFLSRTESVRCFEAIESLRRTNQSLETELADLRQKHDALVSGAFL